MAALDPKPARGGFVVEWSVYFVSRRSLKLSRKAEFGASSHCRISISNVSKIAADRPLPKCDSARTTRFGHWLFSIPDVCAPPFGPAMLVTQEPQWTRGSQGILPSGIYEFRSSDRSLFSISRVKPVYESASLKFIDER
jgi:hypothetical protein